MANSQAASAASPQSRILDLIAGVWAGRTVGALAQLGVADHLATAPRTAAELAPLIGANETALHRLLRAAAGIGALTHDAGGRFGLTALGQCLRSKVPGSMRAAIASEVDTVHWSCWGRLDECIRSGEPAFQKIFGMENPWDYYRERNPAEGRLFSQNMTDMSGSEVRAILSAYPVDDVRRVVDVGGAHGAFLAGVLAKAPQARGVLFDRQDVVDLALPSLEEQGVANRVERVGGSFFESVPAGGDLYLLKHILHDWNDEECVRILRCIRAAMAPGAHVAVAEMPLVPGDSSPFAALLDINMLVCLTGKERTLEEYAELFRQAGLEMAGYTPTETPMGVIEARAAREA